MAKTLGVALMAAGLAYAILAPTGGACGLDWMVPITHFDGVDAKGHVCYAERIGEIDLGQDLKLPLIITFRSDRETSSPYLGKGWVLALLDSNFVQTGENTFLMTQPDGWIRPFNRARRTDTVLDGGTGWKAEIDGNTIIASAECGWRLTYQKGKLATIDTPKNRHLVFIYSDGVLSEIRDRDANMTKVSVDQSSLSGNTHGLLVNGKRIEIEVAPAPQVQVIGGHRVVAGISASLHSIKGLGRDRDEFEFAVDDSLQPSLKVIRNGTVERQLSWDPQTKMIVADNEWRYKIEPSEGNGQSAGITRTDRSGHDEYWHRDPARGTEVVRRIDGSQRTVTVFSSGLLAGKTRRITDGKAGAEKVIDSPVYDENGNLLREAMVEGDYSVKAVAEPLPAASRALPGKSLLRPMAVEVTKAGTAVTKYEVTAAGELVITDSSQTAAGH